MNTALTTPLTPALPSADGLTIKHVGGRLYDVWGTPRDILDAQEAEVINLDPNSLRAVQRSADVNLRRGPYRGVLPPAKDVPAAPAGQGQG